MLLLVCKVLVLILLKLFFYSYSTGAYDERWLQFGILCAACINFPIWLEKKEFERKKLKCFLNQPHPIFRMAWIHFYITIQIIAPELLYLMVQYPNLSNIGQAFTLVVLIVSLNLGIFAPINCTKAAADLPRNTILVFFSLFFLIIFGFPAIFVSILAIAVFLNSINSPYTN